MEFYGQRMRNDKKKNIAMKRQKDAKLVFSKNKDISSDFAFQKIKQMMYRNELAPGQKIIYKDLAKRLNLSITPVVNALGQLEMAKLVSHEINRGYFVRMINENETRELYNAREALETFIIPDVVENMDTKKLDLIKNALNEHVAINSSYHRRVVLLRDLSLHLQIVEIAKNAVIHDLLRSIFERIYLGYRPEYLINERIKSNLNQHRAILNALEKRNVNDAIELTRKHIKNGMDYVIKSIYTEEEVLKEYDYISGIDQP
jgi:DNA-binding GntR family transcriptional regulator